MRVRFGVLGLLVALLCGVAALTAGSASAVSCLEYPLMCASGALAGEGPGSSLSVEFTVIENQVAAGDLTAACGTTGALINEVNAQSGITIDPADGTVAVLSLQEEETALGCS